MCSLLVVAGGSAQYTDMVVGQKQVALTDSLTQATCSYLLPAWGQRVVNKGFDLLFSAGLSAQYVWQESDIIISNLQVGFNNGTKHNMDELIRFDKSVVNTNGYNCGRISLVGYNTRFGL